MAKYENILKDEYNDLVEKIKKELEQCGMSLYEQSAYKFDDVDVTILVYKKFYARNLSRAILNLTLIGKGDITYMTAMVYGGGQGIGLEFNNGAEEDMLATVQKCIEQIE